MTTAAVAGVVVTVDEAGAMDEAEMEVAVVVTAVEVVETAVGAMAAVTVDEAGIPVEEAVVPKVAEVARAAVPEVATVVAHATTAHVVTGIQHQLVRRQNV